MEEDSKQFQSSQMRPDKYTIRVGTGQVISFNTELEQELKQIPNIKSVAFFMFYFPRPV